VGSGAISPEVAEFLEEGHSIVAATRDARHVPEVQRAVAARVDRATGEVTIYLPQTTSAPTVANLEENGRIAVTLAGVDHRSVQIKGRLLEMRAAGEEERGELERYRSEMAREWALVGVPTRITLRLVHWPCLAVRFRPDAVFVQTPGPGAGEALGGGAEPLGPSRGLPT